MWRAERPLHRLNALILERYPAQRVFASREASSAVLRAKPRLISIIDLPKSPGEPDLVEVGGETTVHRISNTATDRAGHSDQGGNAAGGARVIVHYVRQALASIGRVPRCRVDRRGERLVFRRGLRHEFGCRRHNRRHQRAEPVVQRLERAIEYSRYSSSKRAEHAVDFLAKACEWRACGRINIDL